jgi:hypothetical protein
MLLTDQRLRGAAALCPLPAVRVGNEWRILLSDVEAWIASHSAAKAMPPGVPAHPSH